MEYMDSKTRTAILTLLADLLTASTGAFLVGFATALLQKDWQTAIMSLALAICDGFATIYFRRQL
jgi:hypothetical protein